MPLDDDVDDVTDTILRNLPEFFKTVGDSNHEKVLRQIGDRLAKHNDDIQDISWATFVKEADEMDELRALGEYVGVQPRSDEDIENYRDRLLIEYQIYTSEGTIADVINLFSNVLETDPRNIEYDEPGTGLENGTIEVSFPRSEVDSVSFSISELLNNASKTIAASYSMYSPQDPRYHAIVCNSSKTTSYTTSSYAELANKGINGTAVGFDGNGYGYVGTTGNRLFKVDGDLNVSWRAGIGFLSGFSVISSVAVHPDGVLACGGTSSGAGESAMINQAQDGDRQWSIEVFNTYRFRDVTVDPDKNIYNVGENGTDKRSFNDGSLVWNESSNADKIAAYGNNYIIEAGDDLRRRNPDGSVAWEDTSTGYGSFDRLTLGREGDIYMVGDGEAAAKFDAADGSQLWTGSNTPASRPGITYMPKYGGRDDKVVLAASGGFWLLDPDTGNRTDTISANINPPSFVAAYPDVDAYLDSWQFV